MAFGTARSITAPVAGAFGSPRTANPPSAGQFGAVSAAWTPAELFADSQDGFWYDPSDLSTVWEDDAGTTPASVNGVVGRIDDKSGNGNYATQSTAAAKPILRQSGSLYYLEFDNTDDVLVVNTYRPTPSSTLCFSLGLTCTDTQLIFFSRDTLADSWFYAANSGSTSTVLTANSLLGGVWKNGSAATPIVNRGDLYNHVNGADSLSAKITIQGTWNTSTFQFSGASTWKSSGNYYGIVVSTDDWTSDERTAVDDYMMEKKGL